MLSLKECSFEVKDNFSFISIHNNTLLKYKLSEQMKKNRFRKTGAGKPKNKEEDEMNLWEDLLEASKLGLFPKVP